MVYNKLNPHQAYQAASITVYKDQQIVMLYDGAIKYMQQGYEAIKAKKHAASFKAIDMACAIINGLASSLDPRINKEIAHALGDYYHSLDARMLLFQHNHDMEMYDQIMDDLKYMRDAWQGIAQNKKH